MPPFYAHGHISHVAAVEVTATRQGHRVSPDGRNLGPQATTRNRDTLPARASRSQIRYTRGGLFCLSQSLGFHRNRIFRGFAEMTRKGGEQGVVPSAKTTRICKKRDSTRRGWARPTAMPTLSARSRGAQGSPSMCGGTTKGRASPRERMFVLSTGNTLRAETASRT